jgi:hypothetical protein
MHPAYSTLVNWRSCSPFGPYADTQSATNARHDLEANGFKSIVKR